MNGMYELIREKRSCESASARYDVHAQPDWECLVQKGSLGRHDLWRVGHVTKREQYPEQTRMMAENNWVSVIKNHGECSPCAILRNQSTNLLRELSSDRDIVIIFIIKPRMKCTSALTRMKENFTLGH